MNREDLWVGDSAAVVECLPSKCKALSSNPSEEEERRMRRRRERRRGGGGAGIERKKPRTPSEERAPHLPHTYTEPPERPWCS
jgi:hypothetical protein